MVNNRLKMILTQEEISRLQITETNGACIKIIADVHGMKCYQARRFINNIINVVRGTFQLIIVHGYNHGTAIKEMLADNFTNYHITEKCADPFNKGVTRMQIAA